MWVDNLYIMATCPQMFANMVAELSHVLWHGLSLQLKPGSAKWTANEAALKAFGAPADLTVDMDSATPECFRSELPWISTSEPLPSRCLCLLWAESLCILGASISLKNVADEPIHHRLRRGEIYWHKHVSAFTNKRRACLRVRMRRFYTYLAKSVLWGCEAWVLSNTRIQSIRKWEERHLRRILGVPRTEIEQWYVYAQRMSERAHFLRRRFGLQSFMEQIFQAQFRWQQRVHTARSQSLFRRILEWRDRRWWIAWKLSNELADPANRSSWRHSRPGFQERSDQVFYRILGGLEDKF